MDGVDAHHALVDLWQLPVERTRSLLRAVEDTVVTAALDAEDAESGGTM